MRISKKDSRVLPRTSPDLAALASDSRENHRGREGSLLRFIPVSEQSTTNFELKVQLTTTDTHSSPRTRAGRGGVWQVCLQMCRMHNIAGLEPREQLMTLASLRLCTVWPLQLLWSLQRRVWCRCLLSVDCVLPRDYLTQRCPHLPRMKNLGPIPTCFWLYDVKHCSQREEQHLPTSHFKKLREMQAQFQGFLDHQRTKESIEGSGTKNPYCIGNSVGRINS